MPNPKYTHKTHHQSASDKVLKKDPTSSHFFSSPHSKFHPTKIDQWPRERLIQHGSHTLNDVDLLSLLIGTGHGSRGQKEYQDVHTLASRILEEKGGLIGLSNARYSDLCALKGIGPVKACRILAGMEISRRLNQSIDPSSISTPSSTLPPLQNKENRWVDQGRKLWLTETTTVLALQNRSFDEALTLSLDQGLNAPQSFGGWLKRIFLHSSSTLSSLPWILLVFRDEETLSSLEIENAYHLYELAAWLDLPLQSLYVINQSQYWTLTPTPPSTSILSDESFTEISLQITQGGKHVK